METNYQQKNYSNSGLAISIAIHASIIAVCFLFSFNVTIPVEEIETGGIVINYGTTDEGMGTDMQSTDEPAGNPNIHQEPIPPDPNRPESPVERTSSPTDDGKNVVTQNIEDAPEVKTGKNNTVNTTSQSNSTNSTTTEPVLDPNASFKKRNTGAGNNGTGGGDGTSNKPGNQGDPNGDPNSRSYTGGTIGNGIALDLSGRRFMQKPTIQDDGQTSGRIVVKIRVDKLGKIISATAGARGTTITSKELWDKCEKAILAIKLNAKDDAPEEQIGSVTFTFSLQ